MSKILVPGQNAPEIDNNDPGKVKATIIFQDANYTILRHKESLLWGDLLDLPLHLIYIGLGLIDANKYIPKIGKEKFLQTILSLKTNFTNAYKIQKSAASKLEERPAPEDVKSRTDL